MRIVGFIVDEHSVRTLSDPPPRRSRPLPKVDTSPGKRKR